jgi:hypothetical protein
MKIIIKEANQEKINAAIREAEGRATARTITAQDIISAAEKVTKHLGIPMKAMIDVVAHVDINAQDFPRAYKYVPESTQFRMIRTASGWALTDIYRDRTHRSGHAAEIRLTETAKEAVLASASVINNCEI